jgi:hypothetical protein
MLAFLSCVFNGIKEVEVMIPVNIKEIPTRCTEGELEE